MNIEAMARIAFVAKAETAYTRQLVSGLSQYAKPSRGFIVREFFFGREMGKLPASFDAWSPNAIIGFFNSEDLDVAAITAGGRPLVFTSREEAMPGRGVVLGDADEVYRFVHDHFRQLGIREVVQVVFGESQGAIGTREQYRNFANTHGIRFRTVVGPEFDESLSLNTMLEPDRELAQWLLENRRGIGVFTQQSRGGSYLCRACELLGIAVPDEFAIIGTDGFDVAMEVRPPVTTIQVPGEAVGFEAGRLVSDMLKGQPNPLEIIRVGGARLIVRGSTQSSSKKGFDVDSAMDFIFRHACEGIRVNDVISHTQGVSRMTFHKHFVEAAGKTPGEAIKERRLSEARRLLAETALSTGAVAGMCGFLDYMHFYRVFRSAEGIGPRDYRKAMHCD